MAVEHRYRGPQADYSETTGGGRALAEAIGDTPQAHVARDLGISPAFLNHLIRGRKTPGLGLAVRIQQQFGVQPDAWKAEQS